MSREPEPNQPDPSNEDSYIQGRVLEPLATEWPPDLGGPRRKAHSLGLFTFICLLLPFLVGGLLLSKPVKATASFLNPTPIQPTVIATYVPPTTAVTATDAPPVATSTPLPPATSTPAVTRPATNTPGATSTRPATTTPVKTTQPATSQPTNTPTPAAFLPTQTSRPRATHTPTRTPFPVVATLYVRPTNPPNGPTATLPAWAIGDMVFIPKGIFRMGCDVEKEGRNCQPDEMPLHSVSLEDYRIDRYEVTNAQYAACVAAGACQPPASIASTTRADYYTNPIYAYHPVINVTWWNANAFCLWVGKRLPNEAEWEKAARFGKLTRIYPWGDRAPVCTSLNFQSDQGPCIGDATQIGSYPSGASQYGVMDMAGNVAEWVFDWHQNGYYYNSPSVNPTGPISGEYRVVRGGSWASLTENVRTASRDKLLPDTANLYVGFRCAAAP